MPKKKPYFPNNWKAYSSAPAEWFEPISFEELMDWKMAGWELPSSVVCMIRETNTKTGKVKEHIYQRESAAKNKARAIMDVGESEFIVCTPTEIHHMTPEHLEDYDDPLA
tara:strand:+ start:428 stop:757 length:330 start_codon:yes stop_codon:yes gene_type:complete